MCLWHRETVTHEGDAAVDEIRTNRSESSTSCQNEKIKSFSTGLICLGFVFYDSQMRETNDDPTMTDF